MKTLDGQQPCPCGRTQAETQVNGKKPRTSVSPLRYAGCCGRWLDEGALAPDAESLMRSRYSAFVLEREAYLLDTWAASHRPARVEFEPGVRWLGLEVREQVQTSETTAEVEFVARHKPASGAAVRLHERSRFVCEGGRWLYVNGDML